MPTGLLGLKLGMTQVFDETGAMVPVTVLKAGPCVVLQVKTPERDAYGAVQLGFVDKPRHRGTQPERGHVRKAGTEPKRYVREFGLLEDEALEPGQELTVAALEGVRCVDVTGLTKGRGFTGVMRRHGFKGHPGSHGTERKHRASGSVGTRFPQHTRKGARMAGHMGAARRTVRNLEVVRIDQENHLLVVKGSVPGPRGGLVMICRGRYRRKA
ncbi:MAG: 50S ribosomal protein L3 [Planctomycetes bacterium DG_20]|nr:MAG: 50S ribosomal protein L3 [Planctomycetes bacterium DG_20]